MPVLLFNHEWQRAYRRQLRCDTTTAERRLWRVLKKKQLSLYRFRRQYGIGPFIVDFYCPRLRLAIEVDGDSHFERHALIADQERQAWIESRGIRVVRFRNDEVMHDLEGVVQRLSQAMRTTL